MSVPSSTSLVLLLSLLLRLRRSSNLDDANTTVSSSSSAPALLSDNATISADRRKHSIISFISEGCLYKNLAGRDIMMVDDVVVVGGGINCDGSGFDVDGDNAGDESMSSPM